MNASRGKHFKNTPRPRWSLKSKDIIDFIGIAALIAATASSVAFVITSIADDAINQPVCIVAAACGTVLGLTQLVQARRNESPMILVYFTLGLSTVFAFIALLNWIRP
jgi:predicted membrane channel-forming protein YqfA (hemolysin III family)